MRARKFLKTGCEGVEGGRKHLSYCLFTPLHPHRCKGVKGVKGVKSVKGAREQGAHMHLIF